MFFRRKLELKDDRFPTGMREPERGTYLYEIKRLWKKSKGQDREFLAKLYDHLNSLYVEQRVYKGEDK